MVQIDAFGVGLAWGFTLSAGDTDSATSFKGAPMQTQKLKFSVDQESDVKLGLKRNSTVGSLTQAAFNNMYLYKVSDVIVIKDNATNGLTAAEDVDVQFNRAMSSDRYYPICLPFVIKNWREIFDDLIYYENYTDGKFIFKTLAGADTQARKPYLAKPKDNITEDNYLFFNNVTIQGGAGGSWPYPVNKVSGSLVGNWAAGIVPANCYYLDGEEWKLSDGTAPLTSFSCYIEASEMENHPAAIRMELSGNQSTLVETIGTEDAFMTVNVYNLQGMTVKTGVAFSEALDNLPAGIYIVNGKKIVKH